MFAHNPIIYAFGPCTCRHFIYARSFRQANQFLFLRTKQNKNGNGFAQVQYTFISCVSNTYEYHFFLRDNSARVCNIIMYDTISRSCRFPSLNVISALCLNSCAPYIIYMSTRSRTRTRVRTHIFKI